MISIVLPDRARTTSPGLNALPDGRFSVHGMIAITFASNSSSAIAPIADSTAAAPDMSYFISSMRSAGLIEMPPESNVTPFPTSTSGFSLSAAPL
jgi:hypothetical protein